MEGRERERGWRVGEGMEGRERERGWRVGRRDGGQGEGMVGRGDGG